MSLSMTMGFIKFCKASLLRVVIISLLVSIIAIAGCASHQNKQELAKYLADDPHASQLANADATLIVDCLLPGKIKKMGSSFTYVTPRRPVKTSAQDCEIRGGEYVAYDRANYQTALTVWLPLAQEGDMVAQTYVASIYEKGLGVVPNYGQAVFWYQKAAEQGYTRAQYALGYLYEMGLGLDKNLPEAFKWYRQAAGLEEEDVRVAHVELAEHERQKLKTLREAEQALLEKVELDIETKKEQLLSIDERITQERSLLKQAEGEVAKANIERRELNQSMEQDRQYWLAEIKRVKTQLDENKEELQRVEQQLVQQQPEAQRQAKEFNDNLDIFSAEKSALLLAVTTLQQSKTSSNKNEIDSEIRAKQVRLQELESTIDKQRALAEANGRNLIAMMNEVAEKKASLEREKLALAKAQAMLAQDKEEHNKDNTEFKQNFSIEREKQVDQLAKQQAIIAQLEKQKQFNEEKLSYLNQVKNQDKLALLAPKIEVLEPMIPLVRDASSTAPVLKVRGDIKQRDIVGKILSDENLMLVSLNEKAVDINAQGIFKGIVDIPSSGTMVDIVAVDVKGNRSQLKFVLSPQESEFIQDQRDIDVQPKKDTKIYSEINFGDYYALLIGNNDYRHLPKLLTPIQDIETTAEILKSKYGFKEAIQLKNATRYDIITQLNALRKKLTEKDNLVIYYAGHGEIDRVNMTGQWLPVDAEPGNTANWISNGSLTELINAITAKHVLVVADSCYSGLLTRTALTDIAGNRSELGRATWFKKMAEKRARLVLTSGGVAPVLDEGGGEHSIFARAFIDALEDNQDILEGQKLFRQVSAMVAVAADRYKVDQVPEYAPIRHAGHESGDFLLIPSL